MVICGALQPPRSWTWLSKDGHGLCHNPGHAQNVDNDIDEYYACDQNVIVVDTPCTFNFEPFLARSLP